MACTIELRSLNSISVPNLVSKAQRFLKTEDPSQINLSGPGARSLHRTRTVTTKKQISCGSIHVTCNFGITSAHRFGLLGRQKNNRCKIFARALHVHNAFQPLSSYGAKKALPMCTHVQSLVALAQSFFEPEDPTSNRVSAPRATCTPRKWHPQWILSWYGMRVICEFGIGGATDVPLRAARK